MGKLRNILHRIRWQTRTCFISCLLMTLCLSLKGQYLHFSHAFQSHLILNPANTGRFNGDWRMTGMYRQQGLSIGDDYQTAYFAFEIPKEILGSRIDWGLYYIHDNSSSQTFPSDRMNLSLAHGLRLTEHYRMHLGIQIGYTNKQLGQDGLSYPDQYNRETGGFDGNMPTGEKISQWDTQYPDVGWGMVLVRDWSKGVITLGYSTHNLNEPTESFMGQEIKLPYRHVGHVKYDANLSSRTFIIGTGVFSSQNKGQEFLTGVHLGYELGEWNRQKNNFLIGLHLRNVQWRDSRSLIVSSGCSWQFWNVMLSYDLDLSQQRTTHVNSQALELGLSYRMPIRQLSHQTIPCERY